jgi:hypothetical protein
MSKQSSTFHSNLALRSLTAFALAATCVLSGACAGPAHSEGLSVVAPTSLGEGHGDPHPARPAGSSFPPYSTPAAAGGSSPNRGAATPASSAKDRSDFGAQPDPAPLVTANQWDLRLHYTKGTVSLEGAKPVELRAAVSTPRQMGRFAVELWVGKELVDRVRFEFPLLGADFAPSPGTHQERGAPRFSKGADTVTTVRVPSSDRATSAQVVDRLTGATVPISWPPVPTGSAASAPATP